MMSKSKKQYELSGVLGSLVERRLNLKNKDELYNLIIDAARAVQKLKEKANDIVFDDCEEADRMINDARIIKELIVTWIVRLED